ncbi:MAG TPA: bifunctional [glutamate--ammonia ligase]-adenylyl-L-tyrosine phosphorylase/[glutamate--ammonia-ligase] adenylyltransferase [Candidatus Udaeobacter sp.]|jgi:glutamate-ammonia-ligase adenylyltransferase|nr:bifunctional [glutamate--ammonia ligase]-adenylyl-L-tyrosine phosphorylase/[glutamate--ammonia-ligase] adenylyltransferase [Candidatus Udaeobacter sp.]
MDSRAHWIANKAISSLNPSQVETTLIQLSQQWPESGPSLANVVEGFPLGEAALLHLLAMSSVCATRLTQNPETLLWLSQPEVCLSRRGYTEMLTALHFVAEESATNENFAPLRFWKGREMTRVAVRELAGVAPLEETTGELSQIAEICIRRVFEHWNGELRQRYGAPKAEFAILALGKLGGGELNHSSDVDLLFVYSEEGQLTPHFSYHEFFNRLGNKIFGTFSTPHPAGPLFRVDLRLRPEGMAGPLARSLESMENYYAGFGETWERIALIKARGIAGNRELAYDFLRLHQPFIFPKSGTPDLLGEIANIKRRIERDVVGTEKLERDVKLGRGGIREIEFIVQTLQLIHGARHPFLQEPNMLKALYGLRQLDLLPREEVLALDNAYRFLRRVEHRVQIEAEQQTHTVPHEPKSLLRLARSLRFSSTSDFTAALQKRMQTVRPIFQRIISEKDADPVQVNLEIFDDPKRAEKALRDLERGAASFHVATRTRQIFQKLRAILLGWLGKVADPDATLNQFLRFVEAYGLRSLLFELLVTNPKLLELLVKTFDVSWFAGELLIRRPQLLEDVTRDPTFDEPRSVTENLRRLELLGAAANNLDPIRAYKQRQLLRIILREVVGLVTPAAVFNELSDLAEACLVHTARLIADDQTTVIALGKFGGSEVSYGADLDVIFVGEGDRGTQNLITAMAHPTAEGNIWALDTRLRPEGANGPLVCSLQTYRLYYAKRAQLWELQSLTRARPISGPLIDEFMTVAKSAWRRASQDTEFLVKIDRMLERIRTERGSGSDFLDLKTGQGGIIEAEFLVQASQMREAIWEPKWQQAVDLLSRRGVFTDPEATKLKESYGFLRHCESVLRRYDNKAVSALPSDSNEQRKLSIRLGYDNFKIFRRDYVDARETIHAIYQRHLISVKPGSP